MRFDQYFATVLQYAELYPEWRIGQTYCNVLSMIGRDDLRDAIQNTHLDPFYVDANVPGFVDYLKLHWGNVI